MRYSIPLLLIAAIACSPGEAPDDGVDPLVAGVAAAEEAKAALDAKREQLAELLGAGEADETTLSELAAEIQSDAEAFGQQIVDVINGSGMIQGEPLNELQLRAVRLKSAEEMHVARQYIDEIGNYERAIAIYEEAFALDPDNPELQEAMERATRDRYMTRERFDQARQGMSDARIRELLGPVRPNSVREFDRNGRELVAWLYPREDGGAAGVWFERKSGKLEVYRLNFEETPAGG